MVSLLLRTCALAVLIQLAALTTAGDCRAQGYAPGGYQSYQYYNYSAPVPYRNNYHGYWRDLGYGFSGNRYYHSYGQQTIVTPYAVPGAGYHYYSTPPHSRYRRYGW